MRKGAVSVFRLPKQRPADMADKTVFGVNGLIELRKRLMLNKENPRVGPRFILWYTTYLCSGNPPLPETRSRRLGNMIVENRSP